MITFLLIANGVVLSLAAYWLSSVQVYDAETMQNEGGLRWPPILCGTIGILNLLIAGSP